MREGLRRGGGLVLIAVAGTVGGGCSFAPGPRMPATIAELPAAYDAEAPRPEAAHEPGGWWRAFDDATLDGLIETALVANLDLHEAVARLEELRHRYRIARAPLFPALTLDANGNRSSSPANTGLGSQFGGDEDDGGGPIPGISFNFPDRFEFTTYSASLGFAYELDFWGRLRNESGAAVRDFLASRADAETVRLTVIASTISTYLEVVSARAQVAIAEDNVDLLRERAELTQERYQAGVTNTFELYAIRQQYRTAESNLPGLRTAVNDAEGRLALLVGRYAGMIEDLLPPELEPAVDTTPIPGGLPVSLLEDRPDVMAAFERVEAARRRVGARRAELLPTISLNGAVGRQAGDIEDLQFIDQWFTNLIGGLVAPIFQGGRLRANLGAAWAQYDQAMIAYGRTVLEAYREVRTSLRQFENERERHAQVMEQVADARASLENQLERYQSGVGDYVEYLDARVNLNGAETTRVLAERGIGEARLAVHRALGGAWVAGDVEDIETGDNQGDEPSSSDRR
ncbi:efflux transporter outer membrane subunit [Candidatus Palauibacter sp.]|uniref:efflux transporter outer membrane subunit n=1 Tax=Candidatus Palauibacter sp. TaxID=3101350 RepID=UPI003B5220ED